MALRVVTAISQRTQKKNGSLQEPLVFLIFEFSMLAKKRLTPALSSRL